MEFTISFRYNNMDQKAEVLVSGDPKETEYDVRPVDPAIVRKYGKQIRIFRIKDIYNTRNHIATDYKDFFNSLVDAIRVRDKARL